MIHKGPASFSWTLELSSECLLCSEGFSAGEHMHAGILQGQDIVRNVLIIAAINYLIFGLYARVITSSIPGLHKQQKLDLSKTDLS